MTIHIESKKKGHGRVRIEGEMTIYNAVELKDALIKALAKFQYLEVDLAEVTEIDTSGLQLLLLLKRESVGIRKTLQYAAHSPSVIEAIDVYNLAAYLGDPLVIPRPAVTGG